MTNMHCDIIITSLTLDMAFTAAHVASDCKILGSSSFQQQKWKLLLWFPLICHISFLWITI